MQGEITTGDARPVSGPLLTILIPSYNRGARVKALVGYLLPLVDDYDGRIEFIVSNNKSTDGTERLLADVASPHFRLHNREVHLPTAEENVFHSVGLCRGEYVWCLGDDDVPNLDSVRATMSLLDTRRHDALVFNSFLIDSDGGATGGWIAPLKAELLEFDYVAGACALGFTFSFAGISNTILRLAPLLATDWRPIAARSLVYSHVVWWLKAFTGRRLTVVNRPLVSYRVDHSDLIKDHFSRVTSRLELPDFYFWTIGFVILMRYLETERLVRPEQIAAMFDYRRDGTHFRMLDNVVGLMHDQVVLSTTDADSRNHLATETIEDVTDWVLSHDPGYFEVVEVMRDIHALRPGGVAGAAYDYAPSRFAKAITATAPRERVRRLSQTFAFLHQRKMATTNPYIGMTGRYDGFAIYRHVGGWVAFDEAEAHDRQAVLRWLDVRPHDTTILVAASEECLRQAICDTQAARASARANDALHPLVLELARAASALQRGAEGMSRNADSLMHIAQAITVAGEFKPSLLRAAYWRIRAVYRALFVARRARSRLSPRSTRDAG